MSISSHHRGALAAASCFALAAALGCAPAGAQEYGAAVRYGEPYRAPAGYPAPSYAGRRPLDYSLKDSPPPRYEPAARPSIWQGGYIGGHGGYAWSGIEPVGSDQRVPMSGGALGLHAGYNWQLGRFVVGVEGDGTWNNASGAKTFAGPVFVQGRNDWTSSLRLRTGIAHDNFLFYVTGGAAFADYKIGIDDGITAVSARDTLFGYAAGGGIEMKFTRNLSGRVEAIHYGFGDRSFSTPAGGVRVDASTTTVRAGLTFHFN